MKVVGHTAYNEQNTKIMILKGISSNVKRYRNGIESFNELTHNENKGNIILMGCQDICTCNA